MENFALFAKVNINVIIVTAIVLIVSLAILLIVKAQPWRLGFKNPPSTLVVVLLVLAPFAIEAAILLSSREETLSYPTGISVHQNTVVLRGTSETENKDRRRNVISTEEETLTVLYDKNTGQKIATLSGYHPVYCAGNMVLGEGNFGYHIADLATGEIVNIIDGDDISARAGELAGEEISSIMLKEGEPSFTVETVSAKTFAFDPVLEKTISPETHTPFFTGFVPERYTLSKFDLKLGEIIAKSDDGTKFILSYTDDTKSSFLISAISSHGNLLWTKRDVEISPKLDCGFRTELTRWNAVAHDQYFYFVTDCHLVCVTLANGDLKWIVGI